MGLSHSPSLVMNGLTLCLDAANTKSILSTVEVLVVAGGGGGGAHHGGGGGGGGLIYSNSQSITPGSAITVTVGNGGTGTLGGIASQGGTAGNGGNSVFGALTAIGGGGGGNYPGPGANGGSGGGSNNWSTSTTGGTGTSGQGFAGGSNNGTTNFGGGGGGAGGTAKGLSNNSGGDGLAYNISGTQTYYSGGGGSGVYPGYANQTSYGFGGLGGGGNGGNGPHGSGTNSTAGGTNTGGGGGGVADYTKNGAAGGSGIVIVRYPGSQRASGGTVTFVAGHTIHTFTTSGTFTPNGAPGTGTIWTDFSNNGNSGTLTNGPTYSSANGGSFVFDGVNDFINCGSINLQQNFSLELWAYTSTNSSWYFGQGIPSTNQGIHIGWYFYENRGMIFGMYSNDLDTPSFNLQFNTWYHFVFTYNHSTYLKQFYSNGVLQNSGVGSVYSGSGQFNVGQSYSSSGAYMNGRISKVSIYNRALSAAEVSQNFNALRGRFGL
jgi:hypothetical protein